MVVSNDRKLERSSIRLPTDQNNAVGLKSVIKNTQSPEESKREEPNFTISIPDWTQELLRNLEQNSPAGPALDEMNYEDVRRSDYNKLTKQIKKTRSKDIKFDDCIGWAKKILNEHSKDLRVACTLCISHLFSGTLNETEKLVGFRDGLILIGEMLRKFKDRLHPQDTNHKRAVLSEFANQVRLNRLSKIETQSKKEFFKITAETLGLIQSDKLPLVIRNNLNSNLKDRQFEGLDIFSKYLDEKVIDDFTHKVDTVNEESIRRYKDMIIEAARLPIEYPSIAFKISNRSLDYLQKCSLPEDILNALSSHQGHVAIGEDKFLAYFGEIFRKNSLEGIEEYKEAILYAANENRWHFLELVEVFNELRSVTKMVFGEEQPNMNLLSELITSKAKETEGVIQEKQVEEKRRREGQLAQIRRLQKELAIRDQEVAKLTAENSRITNLVDQLQDEKNKLKSENEILRDANEETCNSHQENKDFNKAAE